MTFSSDNFLPSLPEHCQVNSGAYGFERAHWLSQALAQAGITTSYSTAEDWGWFLESLDGETEMIIGCGSEAEEGEGYVGKPITWYVVIKPSRSPKQWLQGKAAPAFITPLTFRLGPGAKPDPCFLQAHEKPQPTSASTGPPKLRSRKRPTVSFCSTAYSVSPPASRTRTYMPSFLSRPSRYG